MTKNLTLGDLRGLVARLEGQSDDVPVSLSLSSPALKVSISEFGSHTRSYPVEFTGAAAECRVEQTFGYVHGMGPARGIVIFGVLG